MKECSREQLCEEAQQAFTFFSGSMYRKKVPQDFITRFFPFYREYSVSEYLYFLLKQARKRGPVVFSTLFHTNYITSQKVIDSFVDNRMKADAKADMTVRLFQERRQVYCGVYECTPEQFLESLVDFEVPAPVRIDYGLMCGKELAEGMKPEEEWLMWQHILGAPEYLTKCMHLRISVCRIVNQEKPPVDYWMFPARLFRDGTLKLEAGK